MTSDKLQLINEEVHDNRTPAKKPEETFAYKLFRMGYKLAMWWTAFAAFAFVVQAALIVHMSDSVFIPGIGNIFLMAGGLSIVLVGGEEAIDGFKNFKGNGGSSQQRPTTPTPPTGSVGR